MTFKLLIAGFSILANMSTVYETILRSLSKLTWDWVF